MTWRRRRLPRRKAPGQPGAEAEEIAPDSKTAAAYQRPRIRLRLRMMTAGAWRDYHEPGERACSSASAQRHLSIPAMTPFDGGCVASLSSHSADPKGVQIDLGVTRPAAGMT
jgi:hypothetical protein